MDTQSSTDVSRGVSAIPPVLPEDLRDAYRAVLDSMFLDLDAQTRLLNNIQEHPIGAMVQIARAILAEGDEQAASVMSSVCLRLYSLFRVLEQPDSRPHLENVGIRIDEMDIEMGPTVEAALLRAAATARITDDLSFHAPSFFAQVRDEIGRISPH